MYELLPDKKGPQECDECDGHGKEICTNPDHSFLQNVVSASGGNISACPGCGHDPHNRTPYACYYCDGRGYRFERLGLADVFMVVDMADNSMIEISSRLSNKFTVATVKFVKDNKIFGFSEYDLSKDNILEQSDEFCEFVYELIK